MRFLIRPSGRRDIAGIDQLFARSYPQLLKADYPPSIMVTVVPLFSRAQPKLVTSGTFYVAEDDDRLIVGAGGWTTIGPSGESGLNEGHIRHFATDPARLREGIAGALMDRCAQDAMAAGVRLLNCYSTITAVPFYQSQGFKVLREIEIDFTGGLKFPAVAMERLLA